MKTFFFFFLVIILIIALGYFMVIFGQWLSGKRAQWLGDMGEKTINNYLHNLGASYWIYNDILLRTHTGTVQIDHIVVSPFGIFVIETKNYTGWIFGNENSQYWTKNVYGNKYSLPNPIHQNYAHISALKELLPQYTNNQYISIISFLSGAELKVNVRPQSNVIYSINLLDCILSYKTQILTFDQMKEFCLKLEQISLKSEESRKEHVESLKRKFYR